MEKEQLLKLFLTELPVLITRMTFAVLFYSLGSLVISGVQFIRTSRKS